MSEFPLKVKLSCDLTRKEHFKKRHSYFIVLKGFFSYSVHLDLFSIKGAKIWTLKLNFSGLCGSLKCIHETRGFTLHISSMKLV